MKKILRYGIIIALLVIGLILFYTFRSSPETVKNVRADYTLTAEQLAASFEENEQEANELYLDKVIEVSGSVIEIDNNTEGVVTVYLAGTDMSTVSCSFVENYFEENTLLEGDSTNIKGSCSGYILDVVLNKCAVVE